MSLYNVETMISVQLSLLILWSLQLTLAVLWAEESQPSEVRSCFVHVS
jgi:hypothetical protein